ncbi:hypothetical protein EYC80_007728 [Monilinia laxa]|uniref:Uncharacterized protein n=1 Tax=Monilinia laxa TaxID=61186 RepID=A0A5N6JX79_MONLA|nr:hypothetical protein EYC80_007728 [Monilinia laxa]
MQNLIISLLRTSQTKYLQLLAPNDLLATPKKVPDKKEKKKKKKKKKKSNACEKYHNYHQLKQDISGEIKQREKKGIKLASAEYQKIVIYAIKAMPPGISKKHNSYDPPSNTIGDLKRYQRMFIQPAIVLATGSRYFH